jgi:uncharacterized protein (DUF1499 family)
MKYLFWAVPLVLFLAVTDSSSESGSLDKDILLPPCPDSPNCVSSLAQDSAKRVEPFPLRGTSSESLKRLEEIIRTMTGTEIISSSPDEIQAEIRSLLGFVDDIMFKVSSDGKMIHVRSAARTGYWDLGVNRRRVEKIRKQYLGSGNSRR